MSAYWAAMALAVCVLVQSAYPRWLEVAGARPDLVLILACYLGATIHRPIMWQAFCVGLVQDVFSGYPLGINALSKALVVLVIQSRMRPGVRLRAKDWMRVAAMASLGDGVLTLLMVLSLGTYQILPLPTIATLAASVLYTTFASIPALFVLSRLEWWSAPGQRGYALGR